MTLALTAVALLAALHGPAHTCEQTLRPLLAREAHAHHLPYGLMAAVAERETSPSRPRRPGVCASVRRLSRVSTGEARGRLLDSWRHD